jgi:hypothetical protein
MGIYLNIEAMISQLAMAMALKYGFVLVIFHPDQPVAVWKTFFCCPCSTLRDKLDPYQHYVFGNINTTPKTSNVGIGTLDDFSKFS